MTVTPFSRSQFGTSDDRLVAKMLFDALGRQVKSQVFESPSSYISTLTEYDGLGRKIRSSHPHRASDSPQWTTTTYDALSRVVSVAHPDSSEITTEYIGNTTTVMDETDKARESTTDALGRLREVIEDPGGVGALNYVTTYDYDVLDNLIGVDQSGQSRTFTYDSLSRLTNAVNPESGTMSYVYDVNDNLTQKTYDFVTAPDIQVNYSYDDINRVETTTYATTPDVIYCYDGRTLSGGVCTGNRTGTLSQPLKGRLTAVGNSLGRITTFANYDALGRVRQSTQHTDGEQYTFEYDYNLDDTLQSITYPDGRVVDYTYDQAGRLHTVKDAAKTFSYYHVRTAGNPNDTINAYWAHGAAKLVQLGNGLWESSTYDAQRLQPIAMGLGSQPQLSDLWGIELSFGSPGNNNGNVMRQTLYAPRLPMGNLDQDYEYDEVNRLTKVTETPNSFSREYLYDAFGNRALHPASHAIGPNQPTSLGAFNTATNRLGSTFAEYDAAGNQIESKFPGLACGHRYYSYDEENRLTAVLRPVVVTPGNTCPDLMNRTLVGTYAYDGEGRRVVKTAGGVKTVYVYDAFGRLAAEYSTAAPTVQGGTFYRTLDHLGSTRVVTNQGGAQQLGGVELRRDYYPFGEEILANASTGGRNLVEDGQGQTTYSLTLDRKRFSQQFTGQVRDAESGLDYFGARYLSASLGRFTSVDPGNIGVEPTIPQSWNAYSYVGNNPLRFIDPLGLEPECPDGNSDKSCQEEENPQLEAGVYVNADGQQFFVDDKGNVSAIYENSSNGPSALASLDLATAGIGTISRKAAMAALKTLMGKKAAKDLLEVGTKRAITSKAIQEALSDPKRVQHASQNLIDAGLIAHRGAVAATKELAQQIMERPPYTFQSRMATSGQPVEVFLGMVNGKGVGIAVATEGTAAIRKGQLVTALTYGK